jgi:hypothetical protein
MPSVDGGVAAFPRPFARTCKRILDVTARHRTVANVRAHSGGFICLPTLIAYLTDIPDAATALEKFT